VAHARAAVAIGGGAPARARLSGALLADARPQEALDAVEPVEDDETAVARAAALAELGDVAGAETLLATVAPGGHDYHAACGTVAQLAGRHADAERHFRAAHAAARDDAERATALNALGMVCKYDGRFDESVALYRDALALLGEDHPAAAAIYHNLGGVEHARRDFAAAEPYARRSVELRRAAHGPDHVLVAVDEAALAAILHALGSEDEAEELLRRSLPVLEGALGEDHHEVAAAWNNLGSVLAARGDLDGADAAYRTALESKERSVGAASPALAITLNNLGVTARRRGRPDDAAAFYERAIAILERSVEPDHPNLLLARRNRAKLQEERAPDDRLEGDTDRGGT